MHSYSLEHVASNVLLRDLTTLVAQDRATTASLLAHIAEVKERKLYRGAGQPSMQDYCVIVLRFSEDSAKKRLQAAGVARRFPLIFEALADGRLHLSGVCLLAPHLQPENADELIPAAMNRTRADIEKLLANRFPQADLPEMLQAVVAPGSPSGTFAEAKSAPGHFSIASSQSVTADGSSYEAGPPVAEACDLPASPAPVVPAPQYPRVKPLAPQRYALQVTLDEQTHDLLREAQDLQAHTKGGRQISNVLKRALEHYVRHLKQRKFAETERPRRASRKPKSVRTIPAEVKRAVKARDDGRCTFVNEMGDRCPARSGLEFDHAKPLAQGGETTVENVRLRCRAHNQLAAEEAYGEEFIRLKRERAQRARAMGAETDVAATRGGAATAGRSIHREAGESDAREQSALREKAYEVIPWMRQHPALEPGAP